MKQKRFQKAYRKSASKLHKKVGDILRNSPIFKGYKLYQEYPVVRINPQAESLSKCHYDWVFLDLKVIIEVHGQQHYGPVNFGGMSDEAALAAFSKQKVYDDAKQMAASEAGFVYLSIPYWEVDKLTDSILYEKLYVFNTLESEESFVLPPEIEITFKLDSDGDPSYITNWKEQYKSKKEHLRATGQDEKMKEKAKKIRKAQYQKAKELKKSRVLPKRSKVEPS